MMKKVNFIVNSSDLLIRRSSVILRILDIKLKTHYSNGSNSGIVMLGLSCFFSSLYLGCLVIVWIINNAEASIIFVKISHASWDDEFSKILTIKFKISSQFYSCFSKLFKQSPLKIPYWTDHFSTNSISSYYFLSSSGVGSFNGFCSTSSFFSSFFSSSFYYSKQYAL